MELEAKYAILGPLNPGILASLDLGPYQLYPDGETHHQDVMLDTPTHAISTEGHTLRLRHRDGKVMLTYKGPNRGSDGVHEREEIEAPLSGATTTDFDYQQWPAAIVQRIAPLVGEALLAPIVKLYIHRRTWRVVRDDQTVAEMALDQGIISAGGRTARVHELEVELKCDGTRDDLEELGRRLLAQLPLQPQPRGKLQRGLALLQQHRTLDGHTSLEAVGRHVLRKQLLKLRRSEPAARTGSDPEGVHVMRATTRRLRTTLRILEDSTVFKPKQLRRLRRGLRSLARALGDVRDLDVLMERLKQFAGANRHLAGDLEILHDALLDRRRQARSRLLKRLRSERVARLLAELDDLTAERHEPADGQPRILVRHFAGGAIWRRYEDVLSYESIVQSAPTPVLHSLRIACKRLRYTLELFERELGKGTQPLTGALVKVQDHLGALQDTVVALQLVRSLQEAHPRNTGLRLYADALAAECDLLRRTFAPLWDALSDAGFSQELGELIAGL